MPEPFKNLFNKDLIDRMANVISRVSDDFDLKTFVNLAKTGLEDLEMMARSEQISKALDRALPGDFEDQIAVLVAALHPTKTSELSDMETDDQGIAGWAVAPLGAFIARNGMDDPRASLAALREMTMRFSAEFAVRPFIQNHPDVAMEHILTWSRDDNHHVRRLASEGSRPLLPWGIKLHDFVRDPSPMLPVLTRLRDDPSEYVRKSVANHLNDISKDHPDLISELAFDWLNDAPATRVKLVKHACRGLIKAGNPKALAAFGYGAPKLSNICLEIPDQVSLGDRLDIQLSFRSDAKQILLIDYVIHFMRANGKLSPKVFKWTEKKVAADQDILIEKSHAYKKVTTRKDYAGMQMLSVQINGQEIARKPFEFSL